MASLFTQVKRSTAHLPHIPEQFLALVSNRAQSTPDLRIPNDGPQRSKRRKLSDSPESTQPASNIDRHPAPLAPSDRPSSRPSTNHAWLTREEEDQLLTTVAGFLRWVESPGCDLTRFHSTSGSDSPASSDPAPDCLVITKPKCKTPIELRQRDAILIRKLHKFYCRDCILNLKAQFATPPDQMPPGFLRDDEVEDLWCFVRDLSQISFESDEHRKAAKLILTDMDALRNKKLPPSFYRDRKKPGLLETLFNSIKWPAIRHDHLDNIRLPGEFPAEGSKPTKDSSEQEGSQGRAPDLLNSPTKATRTGPPQNQAVAEDASSSYLLWPLRAWNPWKSVRQSTPSTASNISSNVVLDRRTSLFPPPRRKHLQAARAIKQIRARDASLPIRGRNSMRASRGASTFSNRPIRPSVGRNTPLLGQGLPHLSPLRDEMSASPPRSTNTDREAAEDASLLSCYAFVPDADKRAMEARAASWSPVPRRSSPTIDSLTELVLSTRISDRIRQEEEEKARKEREEQRRKEEEEARLLEIKRKEEEKARLRLGGLRAPATALFPPLSEKWSHRVDATLDADPTVTLANTAEGGLKQHEFTTLIPETSWLNDEVVNGGLQWVDKFVNQAAGITNVKQQTRKCLALGSFFYKRLEDKGVEGTERLLRRNGVDKNNILQVETILIPICASNHWTLLVLRPTQKTVSHMDSLNPKGSPRVTSLGMRWIQAILGGAFNQGDWQVVRYPSPIQTNGYDCGVHTILNGICLALGLAPTEAYCSSELPEQRRNIAAMLLNGGFNGDFDLSGR